MAAQQQLQSIPGYAKAFADAFPGQTAPITLENVQEAIAAFESTLTAPYFHTGSVWDLTEAVRVMGKAQLGQDFSQQDVEKIAAFLGSLQGDQPKVTIPILPASGPDTSRPVRN